MPTLKANLHLTATSGMLTIDLLKLCVKVQISAIIDYFYIFCWSVMFAVNYNRIKYTADVQ